MGYFLKKWSQKQNKKKQKKGGAYGPSGEVLGTAVYVNYGRIEDFELLLSKGVSFEGFVFYFNDLDFVNPFCILIK